MFEKWKYLDKTHRIDMKSGKFQFNDSDGMGWYTVTDSFDAFLKHHYEHGKDLSKSELKKIERAKAKRFINGQQ